jgi:hypothetical protein
MNKAGSVRPLADPLREMPFALRVYRFVGTIGIKAGRVEIKGVFLYLKTPFRGDFLLQPLDLRVVEFFHATAIGTYQMIVVLAFAQFKNGLARLEKVSFQDTGLLKLGEHPVDRRQANIQTVGDQETINVFRAQMANLAVLEQIKYLQARMGGLKAHFPEIAGVWHDIPSLKGCITLQNQQRISGMI